MTKPQPSPEKKPALLVVDDDPLITDSLAFALGAEYTVYACDSRPHAIELLRQLDAPPPLALVDLGLPPRRRPPPRAMRARWAPGISSPSPPIRRAWRARWRAAWSCPPPRRTTSSARARR